ncbi:DinB family protein [Streptomyces sp. DH12]|uniref:DinB family protein n=1 Tax=Streptomyces sp. DH12 TaxID=2857010 RepID=UPI001E283FB6|nr:DinB family protein [Streptomyces sp. DH12]
MTTTDGRDRPDGHAGEREMLEGWLEFHRATLAAKCEGLDDKRLREASVPPSDLSLLGLVRHLAEVERGWFRRVLADEDVPRIYCTEADPDGDLHPAPDHTWEEAYATWQGEIARARELAAATPSLDTVGAGRHRSGTTHNLRWIYTHMIEEYARHNGHADLIRERIDGATGE